MEYMGCGWIATYNALKLIGVSQEIAEVIWYFDNQGMFFGALGVKPSTVVSYLKLNRAKVKTASYYKSSIEEDAKNAKACILCYVYRWGAHYVAFKREGNQYRFYNADPNGAVVYASSIKSFLNRNKAIMAFFISIN